MSRGFGSALSSALQGGLNGYMAVKGIQRQEKNDKFQNDQRIRLLEKQEAEALQQEWADATRDFVTSNGENTAAWEAAYRKTPDGLNVNRLYKEDDGTYFVEYGDGTFDSLTKETMAKIGRSLSMDSNKYLQGLIDKENAGTAKLEAFDAEQRKNDQAAKILGMQHKNNTALAETKAGLGLNKSYLDASLGVWRDGEKEQAKANNGTSGGLKPSEVMLSNGKPAKESDLRAAFIAEFGRTDAMGKMVLGENAPSFLEWRDSIVSPEFRYPMSTPEERIFRTSAEKEARKAIEEEMFMGIGSASQLEVDARAAQGLSAREGRLPARGPRQGLAQPTRTAAPQRGVISRPQTIASDVVNKNIAAASDAIRRGAPREKVIERLLQAGYSEDQLKGL